MRKLWNFVNVGKFCDLIRLLLDRQHPNFAYTNQSDSYLYLKEAKLGNMHLLLKCLKLPIVTQLIKIHSLQPISKLFQDRRNFRHRFSIKIEMKELFTRYDTPPKCFPSFGDFFGRTNFMKME